MKTALLFLFAAELVLYSLLWHNQPARSSEPHHLRKLGHKVFRFPWNACRAKPAKLGGVLELLERQQ